MNDAEAVLSLDQKDALWLGPSFVPHRTPDPQVLDCDLEALRRKINLTIMFAGEPPSRNPSSLVSRVVPSSWMPPDTVRASDQFWTDFRNSIKSATTSNRDEPRNNFPGRLAKAWRSLTNHPDFYTIPADKGGKMVLWSRANYEQEALRQLADVKCYRRLSPDEACEMQTRTITERNKLITSLRIGGFVTNAEATRLRAWEGACPSIYFLPKIHKKKRHDTGTFPGRPIMAAVNGPLVQVDKFLALLTSPLLGRIPGSLKDTRHLLRELDAQRVPPNARLFSADVEALYPSIPWNEGIEAASKFYGEHYHTLLDIARQTNRRPPPTPALFSDLLALIIMNNCFQFQNKQFYHQVSGTAMGCCMSVFFANTFMYARSRTLIETPPPGLLYLGRYIDDLVGVFIGSREEAEESVASITDDNIRLTFVHPSAQEPWLDALDVRLTVDNGRISSTLFRKPTDGHQFLHWDSCHPRHLRQSIPYAQFLRYRVNCSNDSDFTRESEALCLRFLKRGYPKDVLTKAFNKAAATDRHKLLYCEKDENKPNNTREAPAFTFVTEARDSALQPIRDSLTRLQTSLNESPVVLLKEGRTNTKIFNPTRPRLALRCGRALGDSLGPAFKKGAAPHSELSFLVQLLEAENI